MTTHNNSIEENIQEAGVLKVSNFNCSEHGQINPKPICPKCYKALEQAQRETEERVRVEEREKNGTYYQ